MPKGGEHLEVIIDCNMLYSITFYFQSIINSFVQGEFDLRGDFLLLVSIFTYPPQRYNVCHLQKG